MPICNIFYRCALSERFPPIFITLVCTFLPFFALLLQVRALREHLTSCFTSTACWLLPYPGPAVSEDPNFKGTKEEMDPRSIMTHY